MQGQQRWVQSESRELAGNHADRLPTQPGSRPSLAQDSRQTGAANRNRQRSVASSPRGASGVTHLRGSSLPSPAKSAARAPPVRRHPPAALANLQRGRQQAEQGLWLAWLVRGATHWPASRPGKRCSRATVYQLS